MPFHAWKCALRQEHHSHTLLSSTQTHTKTTHAHCFWVQLLLRQLLYADFLLIKAIRAAALFPLRSSCCCVFPNAWVLLLSTSHSLIKLAYPYSTAPGYSLHLELIFPLIGMPGYLFQYMLPCMFLHLHAVCACVCVCLSV